MTKINKNKNSEAQEREQRENDRIRYEAYYHLRKEGWDFLMNSSLAFDKAMTVLSTAFLGFIFAITKNELKSASVLQCKAFLIFILIMLILCIFISLMSFWFDQRYGFFLMLRAKKYHLDGDVSYQNKAHWSYRASLAAKLISATLFMFSIMLFAIFFINMY